MMRRIHIGILAIVFATVIGGCELYSHEGDDRVVEGVSFAKLFRPPDSK